MAVEPGCVEGRGPDVIALAAPMPTFSIVIPTYNRAGLLPEAIESVLAQTVADWELIIVDDGSIDGTADAVAGYRSDSRVQYVYQPNQGRSKARNHGARLAQGEFLGFLDSDDMYLPDALATHLQAFTQRPELGLTIGGLTYIDDQRQPLGIRSPWEEGGQLGLADWLFHCYAQPATVLLRRSWFEKTEGFDSDCETAEDWDLFLRLAAAGCPMAWVQQPVCKYRLHAASSSRQLGVHRAGSLKALAKAFEGTQALPEIAALKGPAQARLHLLFVRKALAAGDLAFAQESLEQALKLDAELLTQHKLELLESLLTPLEGGAQPPLEAVQTLAAKLTLKPAELRRALARVEMGLFFRAREREANAEAANHLRAALRDDPAWLANRGVLSFWLKQTLGAL